MASSTSFVPGGASSVEAVAAAEAQLGARLPPAHATFLAMADGAIGYDGYYRVFGPAHLVAWNDPERWKFAWPGFAGYLCFAESAWGDQYAYRLADLQRGGEAPVAFLDGTDGTITPLAPTFARFVDGLAREIAAPGDAVLVAARAVHGPLPLGQHITFVPSPLLTGQRTIERVRAMDAVAAMIVNGDLVRQLAAARPSQRVVGLSEYRDDRGRGRVRVKLG